MSEKENNGVKYCLRCDETKEASEFGKQSNTKDGLRGWCKKCFNLYCREWRAKQKAKLYWNNPKYTKDKWDDTL